MSKVSFGWAEIALIAVLLAIPITYLVIQSRQDIRQRADETIGSYKIVFSPGKIITVVGAAPTRLSAELIDQNGRFVKSGVIFEWGISSKYSVGTLQEVNQNIASFYPQNVGSGEIYVKATYTLGVTDEVIIGSIPITVMQSDFQPTATPTPTPNAMTLCLETGGAWRTDFPNACRDFCFPAGSRPFCAEVISQGCDCGEDMCWGAAGCEMNPLAFTPLPTPLPTLENSPRPFYIVNDLLILLRNYLTNANILYQPQDQKVNMWDASYVIKFLLNHPDLCRQCETDTDCAFGYYCGDSGYCMPNCLRQSPTCLPPESICE